MQALVCDCFYVFKSIKQTEKKGGGRGCKMWIVDLMVVVFQEYSKAVNDADEKVQLANHIHELVSDTDLYLAV